ncbi:MAG: S41 family peptidase [Bacteroidota bacterium]
MVKQSFKTVLSIFGVVLVSLTACKKEKDDIAATPPPVATPTDSVPGLSMSVLKDSMLYYSRDIYLWNEQIPASFATSSFADPEKLMTGIRAYSKESGFPSAVDRWSFAMKQKDWDNMSEGLNLLMDDHESQGDFGFTVFFLEDGDLRVRLVEPNSPAGIKGIHRGWKIIKINSSTNITVANANFIIKNIYESTAATITFEKPDGTKEVITLAADHYTEKPVYLDSVYTVGSKKIGYLVFNSFLGDEDKVKSEFQRVFNKFSQAGINDIVIDLRYNGGGYVSLQEDLANYLVNNAGDGGIMMTQMYNDVNKQYNKITRFKKTGTLNLSRIYFIVGSGTASASELLINNLKPYMDVRLVGASHTHGKPVGYFPIPVGNEWYIFPVSFRSVNKNGDGNYFDGISVSNEVPDGLDKDWGDVTESNLASVIRNITTGRYKSQTLGAEKITSPEVIAGNIALDAPFLKVTVDKKGF